MLSAAGTRPRPGGNVTQQALSLLDGPQGPEICGQSFSHPQCLQGGQEGSLFVLLPLWNPGLKGVRFCRGQTERALRAVALPQLG